MQHRPRKRYGQHFLHDKNIIQKIIDTIDPNEHTAIVEIGPGRGALTVPLLTRSKTLDVIEIDRDLAGALAEQFMPGQLRVHQTNALEYDFTVLHDKKLKVVGNLPYNVSTPLLFHLLKQMSCIDEMIFMLQEEVVDRICAEPNSKQYGRLSVMIQSQCQVEKLFTVGPGCFSPPPKVESAVIRIRPALPHKIEDINLFASIVKTAFTYRRKTLAKALRELVNTQFFDELGIASTSRAENLSVSKFVSLANRVHRYRNQ